MAEIKESFNYSIAIHNIKTGEVWNANTNNVLEFHFTEDIFCMAIVGKIVFLDTDGIFKTGTLTGNENVSVVFNQDGQFKSTTFKIFDLRVIQASNSDTGYQTLCLYLCNHEFIEMKNNLWQKGRIGKSISNIVIEMIDSLIIKSDENRSSLDFERIWKKQEESNETLDTWAPGSFNRIQQIIYLLPRMSGKESQVSGTLLYLNSDVDEMGFAWNLITLEMLLRQTNLLKLSDEDDGIYFDYSRDYTWGHYNKILEYKNEGASIQFDRELKGLIASDFTANGKTDIIQKRLFDEMYNNVTKLGTGKIREYSQGPSKMLYTGEDDPKLISNILFDRFIKTFCLQHLYKIKVKGHIRRYAGAMIEIAKPSNEGQLKGKYLIKSITHSFKTGASIPYLQVISCIKNAFFEGTTETEGNTNV